MIRRRFTRWSVPRWIRAGQASDDYTFNAFTRTSTSGPGTTPNPPAETWDTTILGEVQLDFNTTNNMPFDVTTTPEDITYYRDPTTGVEGLWIQESDGLGDDFAFFQLTDGAGNAVNAYATIDGLSTSRAADADPEFDPTTSDGSLDVILVDKDGNVILGESGFFDTPQHEPTYQRFNIDSYDNGNVVTTPGDGWDDLNDATGVAGFGPKGSDVDAPALDSDTPPGRLIPGVDDDGAVTDGRFVTIDKGNGEIYIFDIDTGALPGVVADVYVLNTETGQIVYEELNAVNHFVEEHGIRFFLRGDLDNDGDVDADDIDLLRDAQDGTLTGPLPSGSLLTEMFDLDGDGLVDFDPNNAGTATPTSDSDRLIQEILGTEYGDTNLDGEVGPADVSNLVSNFGNTAGWAAGNITGNDTVGPEDVSLLVSNFGFQAGPGGGGLDGNVPEPSSFAVVGLLCLGACCIQARRRWARS